MYFINKYKYNYKYIWFRRSAYAFQLSVQTIMIIGCSLKI